MFPSLADEFAPHLVIADKYGANYIGSGSTRGSPVAPTHTVHEREPCCSHSHSRREGALQLPLIQCTWGSPAAPTHTVQAREPWREEKVLSLKMNFEPISTKPAQRKSSRPFGHSFLLGLLLIEALRVILLWLRYLFSRCSRWNRNVKIYTTNHIY